MVLNLGLNVLPKFINACIDGVVRPPSWRVSVLTQVLKLSLVKLFERNFVQSIYKIVDLIGFELIDFMVHL